MGTPLPRPHPPLFSCSHHSCTPEEKPQTSFLLRQFVFPNASAASIWRSAALRVAFLQIFLHLFQNLFFFSFFFFLGARPRQTPSGLLLAHSPLLSGIHFWSSLSPVAPLSPARLQGHSSLFQVRSTQVKKNPKKQSVVFGRHPEHTCYFLVDKRQVKVIWLVFAKQQCLWSEWRLFGSRSCRGVLFQCLREGEEILWILPVWAQGSRSEQGGLVWELLLIYQTHKTAPPHTKYTL